jgi:hypothetical protein
MKEPFSQKASPKTLVQRLLDRIHEGAYPIRVDQIVDVVEEWLDDYHLTIEVEYGDPDVKEWFYMAVSELKVKLK